MSKFEISKARLAEIIKEEYASLQEAPYLDMPPEDRPVTDEEGVMLAGLEITGNPKTAINSAYNLTLKGLGFESHHMRQALHELVDKVFDERDMSPVSERLTPDQLEIDEELLGKQKKENLEEAHCGTGHGTRDDKQDQDDDGDKDFADVQIARMTASGMDKEDAIKKTSRKKYNKKPSKKAKKVNKESIDAIRELIKQELQR